MARLHWPVQVVVCLCPSTKHMIPTGTDIFLIRTPGFYRPALSAPVSPATPESTPSQPVSMASIRSHSAVLIRALVVMLATIFSFPNAMALDSMRSHQNLTPFTEYYPDETRQLTFSQVKELPDNVWASADSANFSFGFTDIPHWFRVTVSNDTETGQPLLLEIGRARVDSIEVYISHDGTTSHSVAGADHPSESIRVNQRTQIFPLELQAMEEAEIFFRIKNSEALAFPLTLWHRDKFFEADRNDMLIYGAYFGIWLVILIYNTVLYTILPHRALACFIAFVFSFGVHQLSELGLGSTSIWGKYPEFYHVSSIASLGFSTLTLMWFCTNLLSLAQTNRTGLRLLQFFSYPALLVMLAYPFVGYATAYPLLVAISAPNALLVILLGITSAIQGNRIGIYSTIAWTVLLLGIAVKSLVQFQFLPLNFMTEGIAPTGFLLMMLALSFFVAAEYRRQAVLVAQDEEASPLARAITRYPDIITTEQGVADKYPATNSPGDGQIDENIVNAQLEAMVHTRTADLESALEELSQANETLKEINMTDAVTGIKNRHYFDTVFEQEWKRASREKYPISLLLLDIDHFKDVNDKYGHLAGDECLHEVASTISVALKRPADIVARYGGEEFVAVLPYIENKNALDFANKIRSRVEASTYIADGHEIKVTVSIGVCTVTPTDNDDLKDMIYAADIALYEGKNSGRNQVRNAGQLTVHKGIVAS